jgi:hypothetical protein
MARADAVRRTTRKTDSSSNFFLWTLSGLSQDCNALVSSV